MNDDDDGENDDGEHVDGEDDGGEHVDGEGDGENDAEAEARQECERRTMCNGIESPGAKRLK